MEITTSFLDKSRDSKIFLAVASSGSAKIVALVVQIFALPLAIASLGEERFGAFVIVTGLLSFLSLSSAGLFPGLTREVALHSAEKSKVSQLVRHALFVAMGFSVVSFLLVSLLLYSVPFEHLFGKSLVDYKSEVMTAAVVSAVFVLMQVIGGIGEATQTGLQRQHINILWSCVGNILTLIFLLVALITKPDIWFLVFATHGSIAACKIANLFFVTTRVLGVTINDLLQPFHTDMFKQIFFASWILFLAQIAILFNQQGCLYLVGRFGNAIDAANLAVILRIITLGGGFVSMITIPLSPALSDALGKGDTIWLINRIIVYLFLVMMIAFLISLVILLFGKSFVSIWVGAKTNLDDVVLLITAFYFIGVVFNHFAFVVLVALRSTVLPTLVIAAEAAAGVLFTACWATDCGASGGLMALFISTITFGIPFNSLLLWRKVRSLRALISCE